MPRPTKKIKIILLVVLCLAIAGALYLFFTRGQESTDDATIEAHVVSLSPKVAGYVKTLNILDNQHVQAGDVLLEIDPSDYTMRRDRAQATLDAAKAALNASGSNLSTTKISAPSNLDAARAQLSAAQANYEKANNDLKRMQKLSDEARSRVELDAAVAAERSARSNLEDAKAKERTAETAPKTIAAAQANQDQLAAQVKQAAADLALAQDDLDNTKIVAPIDGIITQKGVELGSYVQAGQSLGYLVGEDRWVIANYKETQLEQMKQGQRVKIDIDAFPDAHVEGKIDSVQAGTGVRFSAFPPENATGNFVKIVQRVPVKILLNPDSYKDLPLGPGMSVTPTVYTR